MIQVSIHDNEITMNGHARYAPIGQDIVCASVSTLFQVLIQSLEELTSTQIEYTLSPGQASVKWEYLSESSKVLVDAFVIGIRMIVHAYPKYVQLSTMTRRESH